MKTPKNTKTPNCGRFRHFKTLTLAVALGVPSVTVFGQAFWTGGTSDFNVAGSWNPTGVPTGNASNDSGSNNVVLIQPGDPTWGHGDTLAGQGTGASGSYLQTGSTNNTGYPSGGSWMRLGIGGGSFGYYTLSNGVVNVAGQTHLGENGTGYLEVDGGVYNTGYNGNPGICAGDGDFGASSGTLVLTGGTIHNVNNETWFGEARNTCTGYLYMSGGTFNANNWFVFGRNGGIGYGVMTGGTINFTGGGQFLVGGGGVGSLIQSGGVINVYNQYLVPQSGDATVNVGTNILSGTAVLNVHNWLAVGRNGGYGEMDISGNVAITRDDATDGGSHFDVGASATGIVNQNGGAVTNLGNPVLLGENGSGTWNLNSGIANLDGVVMCLNGGAHGTFNLNGGLLQTTGISSPNSGSIINFNGSTVQATAANVNFISGVTLAYLGVGGVVFDSQGYNITIPQEIDDSGGGTLIKIGSGTLTLTGPNTYSGATLINTGTLATTTAATSSSSGYTVATGAALSVQVATAGTQFSVPGVTFATGASTLTLDLNTFGIPSVAPLNVSGALAVNGTVTLDVLAEAPVGIGVVPLIQYGSKTGSGSFVLGTVPPGETAYVTNTGSSIELVITSAGAPVWNGNIINGAWDISTTANWIDLISGSPTTYHNGEPVLFDDTATGTTSVSLNATVSPGSLTFNNTALTYTLTGSGAISGTTGLTKEGTNTLALLNNGGNSYTGPTVIDGGVLWVTNLANGGSPSAIGAASANPTNLVLNGGTLEYSGADVSANRGYLDGDTNGVVDIEANGNLTLTGAVADIPGAGFVKAGPAQLTYAGTNTSTLAGSLGYSVAQGSVEFAGQTSTIGGNFVVAAPSFGFATPLATYAAAGVSNTAVLNIGSLLDVGDSANGGILTTGVVTQAGGTVVVGGATQIGQYPNGVGIYNLSGGSLTTYNWLSVGRQGAVGTFNMSGGSLTCYGGGNFDIGNSGGVGGYSGTGVFNQTGGALTNTATDMWLGEAAGEQPDSGIWNMSGGTAVLGEVHVGVGGTGTSELNVSGSATITESYLLLANYDNNTIANVNVGSAGNPGGTITVNADMNVGGAGTGTLTFATNGGGKVTVTGTLYLSRFNATADGTVNLNAGGTLVAAYINNGWGFQNNFSSPTANPNAFNFNGGVLQAYTSSTFFIQPYVNAVVQGGGAIINDGGYSVTIQAPLVNGGGGGGLTKLGNGTLFLAGANTYTGTTVVSNGTFGASGSIAGPVSVAAGATLAGDTGSIGTFYINNTLTLAAGSTTTMNITPSSNDEIAGLTSVNYGGALVISNTSGNPLTAGSVYQLFHAASAGTGNFSSITVLPSGSATFSPATGLLTIGAAAPATLNQPVYSGGNLILTAIGGTPNGSYDLLTTTNLLTPFADWTTNVSGVYSAMGTFTNTIPVNKSQSRQFFLLTN